MPVPVSLDDSDDDGVEERWWLNIEIPGKVKSQTPKVEKQEKAKRPKGRAHKREQYTRRFVNVTLAPGGKRKVRHKFHGISMIDRTVGLTTLLLQMNPNPTT